MFSAKDKFCRLLSISSPADCSREIREPPAPEDRVFILFFVAFFFLPSFIFFFFFGLFLLASTSVYSSLEGTAVIR